MTAFVGGLARSGVVFFRAAAPPFFFVPLFDLVRVIFWNILSLLRLVSFYSSSALRFEGATCKLCSVTIAAASTLPGFGTKAVSGLLS